MTLNLEASELVLRHLHALRILFPGKESADLQPGLRDRPTDAREHALEAAQRLARPVVADVREQAVFDGIPLRRAGRVVANGDWDSEDVCEFLLEAKLVDAGSRSIAPARIRKHEEALRLRIPPCPVLSPPPDKAVDGEVRGVGRDSDVEETSVRRQVVKAVGSRTALSVVGEIVSVDLVGLETPRAAGVLEIADQLLLLGVNADNGLTGFQEGLLLLAYVSELLVPVGVRRPSEALSVPFERVPPLSRSRFTVSGPIL